MSIGEAFNRSIEYYDDWMMKALPNYGDIFSTALDLLTFAPGECNQVLDLGAGTGLFSKHVLEKYPKANFVLYDLADKMLDMARRRFENHAQQFRYVVGDYRKLEEGEVFDLVISSLSIHHLEDEERGRYLAAFTGCCVKGVSLSTSTRLAARRRFCGSCIGIIG